MWTPLVRPRISCGATPVPGAVGRVAVELRDGVGAVGEAQRERRHVELAGSRSTPRPSSSSRSMGMPPVRGRPSPSNSGPATRRTSSASKRSLPAETGVWIVNTLLRLTVCPGVVDGGAAGDLLARPLGEEERGVALVEVPDRGRDAQRPQRAHAADAQHQLLVEAHLAAADVEDVGDRAVRVVVVGQVRVQQQDRHPADLRDPHGGEQVAAGQLDADRQRLAEAVQGPQDRQARELEVRVGVLLVPVRVDRLAEEAAAVHEPDADQRQGHVRGGLHVVAGEDAEAAGVDARATRGSRTPRRSRRSARRASSPWSRWNQWSDAVGHVGVELAEDVLVLGHERRVVEELRPVDGALAAAGWGCGTGPTRPASIRENSVARPGCQAPPQVVGEAPEAFELGRQGEGGAGRDGNLDEGFHEREMIDGIPGRVNRFSAARSAHASARARSPVAIRSAA